MTPRALLLTAAIALLPGAVRAEPGFDRQPDPEVQKLRQEIGALKLDHALAPTRDQARALLPLLKEAQQAAEQLRADADKRRPAMLKALTAVRDDLRRTGVVSDASANALKDARSDLNLKQTRERLKELRQKARSILTVEQFEKLKNFDPAPIEEAHPWMDDGELAGPGMGPGRHGFGPGGGPGFGPGGGPGGAPGGFGPGAGPHAGGPHGFGRQPMALRLAISPEFIALVEARAK